MIGQPGRFNGNPTDLFLKPVADAVVAEMNLSIAQGKLFDAEQQRCGRRLFCSFRRQLGSRFSGWLLPG